MKIFYEIIMSLQEKIKKSIGLIQKAERLALKMQPNIGFYVGFSGGKDSQVTLELVKMAKVKYRAIYNVTTNDPAENVRFIKKYYPDVEFSVPQKSYLNLITQNGVPTMSNRWCCDKFKETSGVGCVVITGVRREESKKRAEYEEISKKNRSKNKRGRVDIDKMEANEFRCVGGKDKFMVYPILEWREKDVWEFIAMRGIQVNPCYKNRTRVGCVFCPFAKPKDIKEYCETHPKLKMAFIHAIEKYRVGKSDRQKLPTAEDYFNWWVSRISLKDYIAKKKQLSLEFNDM